MAKRGQNQGSIYQRKDNLWVAAISTPTGRRCAYARTKTEATEKLKRLQSEVLTGRQPARRDITVESACAEWLEHNRPKWRDNTYSAALNSCQRHIVPALGSVKLADLTTYQVQRWLRGMGGTRYAQMARMHLRATCELARRYGWIHTNPVALTEAVPMVKTAPKDVSIEHARQILKATEGTRDYAPVCLMLGCGLRVSEALGLRWQDWDEATRTVTVAGQVQLTKDGLVHAPAKTRSSVRSVVAPSWVAEALATLERGEPSSFIFGISSDTLRKTFTKRLKAEGVEHVHLHHLRHTYASILIDAGLPITNVSAALGHQSAAITLSVYAHKLGQRDTRTAEAMEAAIKPGETG